MTRALAIAVLATTWHAPIRPEPATLVGTLHELDGRAPAVGATIVVFGAHGEHVAISHDNGQYRINELPPGQYKVTIYYGRRRDNLRRANPGRLGRRTARVPAELRASDDRRRRPRTRDRASARRCPRRSNARRRLADRGCLDADLAGRCSPARAAGTRRTGLHAGRTARCPDQGQSNPARDLACGDPRIITLGNVREDHARRVAHASEGTYGLGGCLDELMYQKRGAHWVFVARGARMCS
jgi:hypothetical protein